MDMLLKSKKILQNVIAHSDLEREMAQFLLDDDDYEELRILRISWVQ